MTGIIAPAPFLRLSEDRAVAGLRRLLHDIRKNKAVSPKFTKGSSEKVAKLRTRARLKATLLIP